MASASTSGSRSCHPGSGSRRLEVKPDDLRFLSPPHDGGDERVEVGVVEFHPTLPRVAYTTRSRADRRSADLGKSRVVVQDYDAPDDDGGGGGVAGDVVASFTLRELTKRINEFRTESHRASQSPRVRHAHGYQEDEIMLQSLATPSSPPATMPHTAQMLGAVQRISFISRQDVRCVVPPGYVRDGDDDVDGQRLMIGFRRCVVVVSVPRTAYPQNEKRGGVQMIAYIGPDDLDQFEHDAKASKRQPSSFPIPITENIIAYGCYDGGIRFYDIEMRKQVKSALGPNGRENPVLKLINSNGTMYKGRTHCYQTILPRIISVCASGVAYLWELDLSIDLFNGEILNFNIPPPIVRFDGLVAAVSGRGIPVRYPPQLSPTSIATLSPCSSWEQTDEVQSQFEVSFDPHRNEFHWVFSPEAVGLSLAPHASREERLNMNGCTVSYDLNDLPKSEWPPPLLPPGCIVPLTRTKEGKVSAHIALPSVNGTLSLQSSDFVTIYVTSAGELMAAMTCLGSRRAGSVHLDAIVMELLDTKTLVGNQIYTIAMSRLQGGPIAIGTQRGILVMTVSEICNNATTQLYPIQEDSLSESDNQTEMQSNDNMTARELQSLNGELMSERLALQSRVEELLVENASFVDATAVELDSALSKSERLEKELRSKDSAVLVLKAEVDSLTIDLNQASAMLEKEKQKSKDYALKEAQIVQDDCDELKEQGNDANVELAGDGSLQNELSSARETEISLRNYIALLEEDKSTTDKELEVARQEADKYARKYDELSLSVQADVKEQKSAIDSLVDLLDRQRIDHEKEILDRDSELNSLRKQLSELQRYQDEIDQVRDTFNKHDDAIAKLKAENAVMKADAVMGNEIFLAMKIELQNAQNELAQYKHRRS